jgi:hypothetical protein
VIEQAAMHRLQAVANIGKRAANDDRHGIVEIRPPHLLFNVDRLNVERAGTAGAASTTVGRRGQWKFGILFICHESF